MQLTKLEIKGFKSFGDKVVINFNEGITGIVGPNGCGKSNIVDSIRWVLGEQKISALRSEKMENIIFNGTKTRKATQLAEVSLTFNNTKNLLPVEYNQITITRRYYRSGESEYLLNGVQCRLKDITSLFLDTGIASNSYAIIELKMVDDILNDKDNSRRHLFEEAAGISKFRIRKKETLRKLSEADADLERVEDLLFEIEKNMKSLERQAKQAENYYKIKDEYKKFSVELAKKKIEKHRGSYESVNQQINQEKDHKVSLSKQLAEKESAVEKSKKDLIEKEKTLSSRQKALNEFVAKIRHFESEKKIKNERLKYLNDKSDSLREQLEQDKQSNNRTEFSLKGLRSEKENAEKVLSEYEVKIVQLKGEYDEQKIKTNALQEEVNTLDQNYRNKKEELYQIKKDIEIKEIQINSLKQEMEKAQTDASSKTASVEEFEKKINELKTEVNHKNQELSKLKQTEEKTEDRIRSTEKTIEVIREEKVQVGRKLDAKENEYNLTKSLVDNLEGFPEAIKFLKKKANWKKDAPLLSDIITCDEKYRITIENYLEPFMNYYIVNEESDAYQAINLLSDASKGKAHFFILDKFEKFRSGEPRIFENAIPATEIIEFDPKYKKLVSHILDGVYIVTGSEKQLPDHENCVFITQNGKITKRKFSISGGSVGLFEGKRIGRAKNLEKLEKEIKSLRIKLDDIESNLKEQLHALEDLKQKTRKIDIEELNEKIHKLDQELVSVETKQEQFSEMISTSALRKEDLLEQMDSLSQELTELKPQSESRESELEIQLDQLNNLHDELSELKKVLEVKSSAFNEENINFHRHQNKLTSVEQEISFKQNTFEQSKERIEKNQEDLKKNEEEIKKIIDSNEIQEDELVEMYEEKERIEQAVNEAEKDYYAQRGSIDELEDDARQIQRKRESADTLLMELQNKLNELKLEINGLKERLSVEFKIDIDQLSFEKDDDQTEFSEEELIQKVEKCKERLEKIGPINPMAMEAYNEIKERHVFITNQKQDLQNAKESLLTTIDEIDMVAKQTFLDAFYKIKDNFITVFRSLFTEEDDCDLRLSDPENPLDSSVEIIAKPKGKKPLTINQLSGGEKTLTATSLLFSIYLLKPAPFCIFDEVDAPLDDANIDKFNNIIKKFSEDSQFIIVTHNKRTMASTDVIYGITMIEQGVSRVVPVDLRELA